jgi:hypothetical protein
MSTIKISALPELSQLESNTANTVFVSVDVLTQTTGKFTATTLAKGLYSNNPLNVGNNQILFPNTIAQFAGNSDSYLQVNIQNFKSNGSADVVLTSDIGTNGNNYIDLGINNSTFNDPNYSSMSGLDGYLYVQGPNGFSSTGNLIIGTASYGANVVFVAGGTTNNDIVAVFNEDYLNFYEPFSINVIQEDADDLAPAFTINNYGNNNTLVVNDQLNDTTPFVIDASGNTSIGTSSSLGYKLYVLGNTYFAGNVTTSGTIKLSDGSSPASNSFVQSNDAVTLASAKSYTDSANSYLQSNYLPNTTGVLVLAGDLLTNNVDVGSQIIFQTSGTIETKNGINNSKNLNIIAGTDSGGFPGGSVSVNAGSSNSLGGTGGNINLTPGTGATSNGSVVVTGNLISNTNGTSASFNNLIVSGTTQTAAINTGNLSIVGTSQVSGNSIVYGNFTANGTSTLVGNVSMSGTSIVYGNFTANGTSNLVGNMTVTGAGGVSGFLTVNNSTFATNSALMKLTASNDYVTIPPSNQDYMLQITGKDGAPTRVILDSFGNGGTSNSYSVIAGRSARGNAAFPTVTQTGDVLMRVGGSGYGNSGFVGTGSARIDLVAAENFTDTTKGTTIQFWTTNPGTNTINTIATFSGNNVSFTGYVNPQKGFVYTPKTISGNSTNISIDFSTDSMVRATVNSSYTVTFSNYTPGKVVDLWITNLASFGTQNFTTNVAALNSTINSTTYTHPTTSTIFVKYISFASDVGNTYVSITHA